jgi:hypothetical protein
MPFITAFNVCLQDILGVAWTLPNGKLTHKTELNPPVKLVLSHRVQLNCSQWLSFSCNGSRDRVTCCYTTVIQPLCYSHHACYYDQPITQPLHSVIHHLWHISTANVSALSCHPQGVTVTRYIANIATLQCTFFSSLQALLTSKNAKLHKTDKLHYSHVIYRNM